MCRAAEAGPAADHGQWAQGQLMTKQRQRGARNTILFYYGLTVLKAEY